MRWCCWRGGRVATRHARARRVAHAGAADRVIQQAAAAAADYRRGTTGLCVSRQHRLELAVLLGESLLVLGDVAVYLLQAQHLVLERLDVELLPLAMRPTMISGRRGGKPTRSIFSFGLPLSLSVQLLSSCQRRLAIRLRSSSLRGVPSAFNLAQSNLRAGACGCAAYLSSSSSDRSVS